MPHPASRTAPADPAARTPAGQTSITIRDGASPYGRDLSFPQAIGQLRDGEQVTVVPVDTSAAEPDPRGEPVFGFDVTVYPARTSPYRTSRRRSTGAAKAPSPPLTRPCSRRRSPWPAASPCTRASARATAATPDEAARRA